MNKQNSLLGFLLIGLGAYFFLRHLNIPELSPFYSWPSLILVIGGSFLLHSYIAKDYTNLFTGALLFGFGLHFLAVQHFLFWIDHWASYLLIIGIAFLLHYQKTKHNLIPALILLGLGLFALFTPTTPMWLLWVQQIFDLIESFWPLVIIGFGIYLLKKK
ncbi:LiaI-LiaF-like domain-containing protein [Halobacillus sp. H74]|uniref:LiaI-LiaF-like domain-containing protein n=1 Tax=Halobacillus sp. H74 TaxID=3457436 RepID=UPI003FCEB317